jgi:hypothetical protein
MHSVQRTHVADTADIWCSNEGCPASLSPVNTRNYHIATSLSLQSGGYLRLDSEAMQLILLSFLRCS